VRRFPVVMDLEYIHRDVASRITIGAIHANPYAANLRKV
jgi:hypothetical protein